VSLKLSPFGAKIGEASRCSDARFRLFGSMRYHGGGNRRRQNMFCLALLCEKRARENHVLSPSITSSMLPHATEGPESGITAAVWYFVESARSSVTRYLWHYCAGLIRYAVTVLECPFVLGLCF